MRLSLLEFTCGDYEIFNEKISDWRANYGQDDSTQEKGNYNISAKGHERGKGKSGEKLFETLKRNRSAENEAIDDQSLQWIENDDCNRVGDESAGCSADFGNPHHHCERYGKNELKAERNRAADKYAKRPPGRYIFGGKLLKRQFSLETSRQLLESDQGSLFIRGQY